MHDRRTTASPPVLGWSVVVGGDSRPCGTPRRRRTRSVVVGGVTCAIRLAGPEGYLLQLGRLVQRLKTPPRANGRRPAFVLWYWRRKRQVDSAAWTSPPPCLMALHGGCHLFWMSVRSCHGENREQNIVFVSSWPAARSRCTGAASLQPKLSF
jgi:hypothetical protein